MEIQIVGLFGSLSASSAWLCKIARTFANNTTATLRNHRKSALSIRLTCILGLRLKMATALHNNNADCEANVLAFSRLGLEKSSIESQNHSRLRPITAKYQRPPS